MPDNLKQLLDGLEENARLYDRTTDAYLTEYVKSGDVHAFHRAVDASIDADLERAMAAAYRSRCDAVP